MLSVMIEEVGNVVNKLRIATKWWYSFENEIEFFESDFPMIFFYDEYSSVYLRFIFPVKSNKIAR